MRVAASSCFNLAASWKSPDDVRMQEKMKMRGKNSKGALASYKNWKRNVLFVNISFSTVVLLTILVAVFSSRQGYIKTLDLAISKFSQQQLMLARSLAGRIEGFASVVNNRLTMLAGCEVYYGTDSELMEQMKMMCVGLPPQSSVRWLNKNGSLRLIYPDEGWRKKLVGESYVGELYFEKAKLTIKAWVSEEVVNEIGQKRILVAKPVYTRGKGGNEIFDGVIVFSFVPGSLLRPYLADIIRVDTFGAWVLNEAGTLLSFQGGRPSGPDISGKGMEIEPVLLHDSTSAVLRLMTAGNEGTSRHVVEHGQGKRGKIEEIVAYTPVRVLDKTWSVAVSAPLDEVKQFVQGRYRNELYTLGLVLLVLVMGRIIYSVYLFRWARSLRREIVIRELTEKALSDRESQYQEIFETAADGITVSGADYSLVDVNGSLCRMLGYSRNELIGRRIQDFLTPECQSPMNDFIQGLEKRGELQITETVALTKTHATVPIEVHAVKFTMEEGGLLTVVRDISRRKQAEEGRRKANRALMTLGSCGNAMMHVTDEEGLIREVCRIIVDVGGYQLAGVGYAEQDQEKTVRPIAQWGSGKQVMESLKIRWSDTQWGRGATGRAIRTGRPYVAQYITTNPDYTPWQAEAIEVGYSSSVALPLIDGREAFGALSIYAIEPDAFDADEVDLLTKLANNLAYGITFLRVREERTRAEEALMESRKRLHQARKMEALGTLVAGVAHEINNPINLIMFNIPLFQKIWKDFQPVLGKYAAIEPDKKYGGLSYGFLKKNISELLLETDMASRRMVKIVSDLKHFARHSSVIDMVTMSLNRAVENVLPLVRLSRAKAGVALKLELDNHLPLMDGDIHGVEQIIINLLMNAIEAIDHAGGEIEIVTGSSDGGTRIYVSISDNGMGVDPSISGRIFDPFVTGRLAMGGTGLGLSICYNLVKAHDGEITFDSQEGKGTTFTVYFPLCGNKSDNPPR